MTREDDGVDTFVANKELPSRVLSTYVRLWQLETWLRQMVYVELRASLGNSWHQAVAAPGVALTNDLRLTHMPGPERFPISYTTFGKLLQAINDNWDLFEVYLPPKDLWQAKLVEVSQIRNRVAHFRRGHSDDLDRVLRLMKDIDSGFFKFCTSYNDARPVLPPTRDPVVKKFLHLNQFPYVQVEKRTWAMAGVADPDAVVNVSVNILRRPWLKSATSARIPGQPGYLYEVVVTARGRRKYDYSQLLQDTQHLRDNVVHICLDALAMSVRVTIPSMIGTRAVSTTIQGFLDWVPNALQPGRVEDDESDVIERIAEEWPEYVLGPSNPLSFLTPDMNCSFFSL